MTAPELLTASEVRTTKLYTIFITGPNQAIVNDRKNLNHVVTQDTCSTCGNGRCVHNTEAFPVMVNMPPPAPAAAPPRPSAAPSPAQTAATRRPPPLMLDSPSQSFAGGLASGAVIVIYWGLVGVVRLAAWLVGHLLDGLLWADFWLAWYRPVVHDTPPAHRPVAAVRAGESNGLSAPAVPPRSPATPRA